MIMHSLCPRRAQFAVPVALFPGFLPFPGRIVFGCCLAVLACAAAAADEQTLSLVPGWNAVYLEVQPEPRAVEGVVGEAPIERLVMWLGSERKIQFIANPDEILPEDPEWLTWAPAAGLPSGGGTLHAVLAGHAYLVKLGGNAPVDWTVRGTAEYAPLRWRADDYTLTGLPVAQVSPPDLRSFFAASPAHVAEQVHRLTPEGAWQSAAAPGVVRRGEAYWVYTTGESGYQGPVGVSVEQGGGLNFGAGLPETFVVLTNATEVEQSCVLTPELSAGGLQFWEAALNEGQGGWRPLLSGDAVVVPASGETRVRLAIDRAVAEVAAADRSDPSDPSDDSLISGVLSVSSGAGTQFRLPVAARTSFTDRKGLWVGDVVLDKVSTNIRKQAPTAPAPTDAPFQFRLIVHVDASNSVKLLRQVVQAWDGTQQSLFTDQAKITTLLAADGNPIARRVSTAVLGEDVDTVSGDSGGFPGVWSVPGDCAASLDPLPVHFSYPMGYDHPLNPFKHRFNIDHDNLQSDFTTNQGEGIESLTVTRDIYLHFECTDPQGIASESQWGTSVLGGTYNEKLYGILPKTAPSDTLEGQPDPTTFGSLQMTLDPATAKWTVDALTPTADTPQYESGDVVHGLGVGPHTVQFVPVADHRTPAPITVEVLPYANQGDPTTITTTPPLVTYAAGEGAEPVPLGDNFIEVQGTFRLRKVSDIAVLDPALP